MKVFNEESKFKPSVVILVIDVKETKVLMDMAEEACKARPRKTSWKKILEELETKACLF